MGLYGSIWDLGRSSVRLHAHPAVGEPAAGSGGRTRRFGLAFGRFTVAYSGASAFDQVQVLDQHAVKAPVRRVQLPRAATVHPGRIPSHLRFQNARFP